jgi:hypothetical protein
MYIGFWWECLKEGDIKENLSLGERMLLKWISRGRVGWYGLDCFGSEQ